MEDQVSQDLVFLFIIRVEDYEAVIICWNMKMAVFKAFSEMFFIMQRDAKAILFVDGCVVCKSSLSM
jgi:hypothetical protein